MSEKKPSVFWSFLLERSTLGHAVDSVIDVAQACALSGYTRISVPYQRTDMARNRIVKNFLSLSRRPDDTIVMLDGDHAHPPDIAVRLASYPQMIGVVGALYFRRGKPYDPLFFERIGGRLRNAAEWERGMVYEVDAVATGAIAIKRWVFEKLDELGLGYPWFQYEYNPDSDWSKTEDIFFAERCEQAGIKHYCDTGIMTPHLAIKAITEKDWERYKEEHPEILVDPEEAEKMRVNQKVKGDD